MKDKIVTVIGSMLFALVLIGILYVNLLTDGSGTEVYTEIELEGNRLQSVDSYLIGSDLNKSVEYPDLLLQEIKRRIISHPYAASAEVKSDGNGVVEIKLIEKEFMAVVLSKMKPFLVTDSFEMINIESNSDLSGLPVISNSGIKEVDEDSIYVRTDGLVRAFKLIETMKILDLNMLDNLTEINLRNGHDVILSFTGIKYPVILGKGSESKKIILLSSIWNEMKNNERLFSNSSYVDLRFNNEIFIGKPVNVENNG